MWIDFNGISEKPDVVKINNSAYELTFYNLDNKVLFESVGELNTIFESAIIDVVFPNVLFIGILNPNPFQSFVFSYTDIEINFSTNLNSGNCTLFLVKRAIRKIEIGNIVYNFSDILLKRENNHFRVCCNNNTDRVCESIILQHELTLSQQIALFFMLAILIGLIVFSEITNSFIIRFISAVFSLIITFEWFEGSNLFRIFIIISIFLFLRAGAKLFSDKSEK